MRDPVTCLILQTRQRSENVLGRRVRSLQRTERRGHRHPAVTLVTDRKALLLGTSSVYQNGQEEVYE